VVGNKTAKIAKKTSVGSSHHKKRTLKAKTSLHTTKDSAAKSRDSEAAKSNVDESTTAVDKDTKAAVSKADDSRCTEATKSPATADTSVGVSDTAAEGKNDNLTKPADTASPQSPAAHKPNVIFIDSINSFRYSSEWYSPSKVLPWTSIQLAVRYRKLTLVFLVHCDEAVLLWYKLHYGIVSEVFYSTYCRKNLWFIFDVRKTLSRNVFYRLTLCNLNYNILNTTV